MRPIEEVTYPFKDSYVFDAVCALTMALCCQNYQRTLQTRSIDSLILVTVRGLMQIVMAKSIQMDLVHAVIFAGPTGESV